VSKEHLEFMTAEDTDDLIARLADLNERIEEAKEQLFDSADTGDEDLKALYKRQVIRLVEKKYQLLAALKQSLEGLSKL
jgi:hypothetical protein